MRAAVLKSPRSIEVDRVYPEPPMKPGDLKLRVDYTGICGSDLHVFNIDPPMMPMPVVLGHEFSARVVEVTPEARGFEPGDRAVGLIYPSCGRCEYCAQGDFTLCDLREVSITERNGSFAEYITVPARQLFLVPASTPADEAALIEPASVAVHAIRRSRLSVGERAVVFGGGPLGLLIMKLAQLGGADRVMLVEPVAGRRELARKYGADLALDPAEEIHGQIMDATDGRGADVVFEVAGNGRAFAAASKAVRKLGRMVVVAVYEGRDVHYNPNRFVGDEIDLIHSFWSNAVDFRRAVNLISTRKLDVRPLITGRVTLDQMQSAMDGLVKDRGTQSKILVACS
jgi:(R,R)-butanediol dehydrogenase / meso-butanediol dehydrogenase / diacetyl reductase